MTDDAKIRAELTEVIQLRDKRYDVHFHALESAMHMQLLA
jgi:hypothetical protein